MTPFIWLTLWLVAAVVLLILGAIGAYPVGYRRGYRKGEMDRPKHRAGDPQPALPVAGRLPQEQIDGREMARRAMSGNPALAGLLAEMERGWEREDHPQPPWLFAGESEQGWASESAEYELLTQTAVQPVSVTGEPPIDTGELLAITDRVESWIAQWTAQGNIDRHTIQAGE